MYREAVKTNRFGLPLSRRDIENEQEGEASHRCCCEPQWHRHAAISLSCAFLVWLCFVNSSLDWHDVNSWVDFNEKYAVNCTYSAINRVHEWREGTRQLAYASASVSTQIMLEVYGLERYTNCTGLHQQRDLLWQRKYWLNVSDVSRVENEARALAKQYPPGHTFLAYYYHEQYSGENILQHEPRHPDPTPSEISRARSLMRLLDLGLILLSACYSWPFLYILCGATYMTHWRKCFGQRFCPEAAEDGE